MSEEPIEGEVEGQPMTDPEVVSAASEAEADPEEEGGVGTE